MLIKQTDSNSDGMLSLSDLMRLLCPRAYTTLKNFAARKHHSYAATNDLSHEIEFGVTQVL